MSSFAERFFYNWRMARRGGIYLTGSLVAAAAAGLFAGVARHAPRLAELGLSPAAGLAGFVLLVVVAALLFWRFSSLQDEMFHRIQYYSYGWGGAATVAVLIVWGIANGAGLAPPIHPFAPLVLFAVIKGLFWGRAVGKWL